MRAFARLLDALLAMPDRPSRLALLADYVRTAPDPDRGYGLALLSGALVMRKVTPAMLRGLVGARMDPVLFGWCQEAVGDLAETVALAWDGVPQTQPHLGEVVERLGALSKAEVPAFVAGMLDRLEPSSRFAFLKLVTGALRPGISGELLRHAVAEAFARPVEEIIAAWHAADPPWIDLFAWLDGRQATPPKAGAACFCPPMRARAVEMDELAALDPAAFVAGWQGHGPRVQLRRSGGAGRLFTQDGDDISAAFTDLLDAGDFEGVLEGEMLVVAGPSSGAGLRRRLARKTADRSLMRMFPAFLLVDDLAEDAGEDLRDLPFDARRARLETVISRLPPQRFGLSPLIRVPSWPELDALRRAPPDAGASGLRLMRRNSRRQSGHDGTDRLFWKRDPHRIAAVLLYARGGRAGRAEGDGGFTFGLWQRGGEGEELVPVCRAAFDGTMDEAAILDRYVRDNTLERFGPVRSVVATPGQGLVAELAFEAVDVSPRHRCGLVLRQPRIIRLRPDMAPAGAASLASLDAIRLD